MSFKYCLGASTNHQAQLVDRAQHQAARSRNRLQTQSGNNGEPSGQQSLNRLEVVFERKKG